MACFTPMLKSATHISQLLDQIGIELSEDHLPELIQEAHDNERPLPAPMHPQIPIRSASASRLMIPV